MTHITTVMSVPFAPPEPTRCAIERRTSRLLHVCTCMYRLGGMRTTIEMSGTHRAALLRLAAARGEKGFSRLVAEAIESYLAGQGEGDRAGALRLKSMLSQREADALRARVNAIRENWR